MAWPGSGAQGDPSRVDVSYGVTTPDEARAAVRDYVQMKPEFIKIWVDDRGGRKPTLTPPLWLAWLVTWCTEKLAKLRGATEAPLFNFTRLKFMGYNLDFSIDKARRELGYRPRTTFDEGMADTMAWYHKHYG